MFNLLNILVGSVVRRFRKGVAVALRNFDSAESSPSSVGSYRKRLIDAGFIVGAGYGRVSFAIPYMREYLLEHVEP